MKTVLHTLLICLVLILTGCSEPGNAVSPVIRTPADIYWIPLGLDSNMVVSVFETYNGNILAGTNYGLFISPDSGSTWRKVTQSISTSIVTGFASYQNNTILACTSGKGVFISSDDGNNWLNSGLQNVYISALAVNNSGKIFAATRGNGIFISDSINGSWEPANPDFSAQIFSSLLITKNNIIFAGGTGVYRSDDNGNHWSLKNNGLGYWSVQSLITDATGNICAGTDNGGYFRSADYGENWTKLNEGLTNTEITCLAKNSAGHIFAGTWRGGVFRSVNNGHNWTAVDSGLTMLEVSSLLVTKDDILFAGTFKGIFRTVTGTVK